MQETSSLLLLTFWQGLHLLMFNVHYSISSDQEILSSKLKSNIMVNNAMIYTMNFTMKYNIAVYSWIHLHSTLRIFGLAGGSDSCSYFDQ